jgi:hypothetical protein
MRGETMTFWTKELRNKFRSMMPLVNYASALEQQIDELIAEKNALIDLHNKQVRIIQAANANGQITVQLSEQAPQNEMLIPLETADQQAADAYIGGFNDAPKTMAEADNAVKDLDETIAVIKATALCTNGDATRKTMQAAVSHLMDALKNLEIEIRKLEPHPLIEIHWDIIEQIVAEFNELQKQATVYLVGGTDTAQMQLRRFVEANGTETVKKLYAELKAIAKRGAVKSEVKKQIGRMAMRYSDPPRGKMYTIGLNVLDELRDIAPHLRTDLQKQCITQLEKLANRDS